MSGLCLSVVLLPLAVVLTGVSPLVRSWALGSLPLASSPALGSGGLGESKP